ncbi:MAG: SpoIIE family protein phosphatase, partial [Flavobacteriales bacterium]
RRVGQRTFFNAFSHLFVQEGDQVHTVEPRGDFFASTVVDGNYWIQDDAQGLLRYDSAKEGSIDSSHFEKLAGTSPLAGMSISAVLDDVPGVTNGAKVLILTQFSGLYLYDHGQKVEGERLKPFGKEWLKAYKTARPYNAIALDASRNPWGAAFTIGTVTEGLLLVSEKGKPLLRLNKDQGLPASAIWDLAKGKGAGLWCMTNDGIARIALSDPRTYSWKEKEKFGRPSSMEECAGDLFMGTGQGIYYRKEGKGPLRSPKWSFIEGSKGQCWGLRCVNEKLFACLGQQGIHIWEKRNGKLQRTKKLSSVVSRVFEYSKANPPLACDLILTGGRQGFEALVKKGGKWNSSLRISGFAQEISTITSERKEELIRIWMEVRTKGMVRIDVPYERICKRRDTTLSWDKLLKKGKKQGIRAVSYLDAKGFPEKGGVKPFPLSDRVVFGTDSGLFRMVEKDTGLAFRPDHRFDSLWSDPPGSERKTAPDIYLLKEMSDGVVWFRAGETQFRAIPKGDGYEIQELPFKKLGLSTIRHFYEEDENRTWLCGDEGLMLYDERIGKNFDRSFPCLVREVKLPLSDRKVGDSARDDKEGKGHVKQDSILFGGVYLDKEGEGSFSWRPHYEQDSTAIPELPFSLNAIKFRFAAPFQERQPKVRYRYRLKGFEKRWSKWSKKTRRGYTNLPEGHYTFLVQAKNVYGVKSRTGSFRFVIHPPWYRTPLAYAGFGTGGILFLLLLFWLNSRRLLAQKRKLERTVEERTREIREKNENLEKANEEISRQNEELELQKARIEEAHREITDSINYAERIQNALLQSEEYISRECPNHFILFKPQAGVSGDFYWARKKEGYLYFAAVDCTGHGVPGAFMSMLGVSFLNDITGGEGLPEPGEVLTRLRERVIQELSGKGAETATKDGMDASVVRFPISELQASGKDGLEVRFAGAQNPLYVVREGIANELPDVRFEREGEAFAPQDDRLTPFKGMTDGFEIKGDRMPVGYDPDAADAFLTASFTLPRQSMLYLSSDGFADQFGGPKGKKFRYGPFKELLTRIHQKPLSEQKAELDRTFEEWKGDEEQLDDVCVIGIQL